jgi:hypothetical protein
MTQKQINKLNEIVGSLMISQFKGKDKQEQYREVISQIFYYFFKSLKKINNGKK